MYYTVFAKYEVKVIWQQLHLWRLKWQDDVFTFHTFVRNTMVSRHNDDINLSTYIRWYEFFLSDIKVTAYFYLRQYCMD